VALLLLLPTKYDTTLIILKIQNIDYNNNTEILSIPLH